MILAHTKQIGEYERKGWWGTKTLLDYFHKHVMEMPEHTALVDPLNRDELTGITPERLSYHDLDDAVQKVAGAFIALGIQKDDILIVQLPNTWELAMLYLATAQVGAIISPIPMQWRLNELRYVARLTEAKAFITIKEFRDTNHEEMGQKLQQLLPGLKHCISLKTIRDWVKGNGNGVDDRVSEQLKPRANDIFTICWTSGTEADPKGCPMSHNNWIFQCQLSIRAADIRKGDVQFTAGPLINMASLGTTFIPWLMLGGTYVLHHPFDPQVFVKQMIQERVNYTLLVPAVANLLAKHPNVDQFDFSSVRSITLGSAPLSLFAMQEFKRRWNIDIGNIWGQNEGTGIVSGPKDVPNIEERVDHLPQFGKAGSTWIEGIESKIVDPTTGQELIDVGEIGELAYKGPNVFPGYYKRPDLTAKAFDKDGFFYTGDLFKIREKNCISFFDRKKDIIIRGGHNISAQEVENILISHPKIIDVAAVGMPDNILGERTCVFVVTQLGETLNLTEVKEFMHNQKVAKYKWPERVELIDAIPRNSTGKILKAPLRERLSVHD
ncbi:acyl-CoA synthetase (AMP-forming)/AMP-acid ligase II [Desulfosporosinus orientis DSM 765]|uniref:Acyl-CoA synthetase (AMP-forming)/AMP-acid ligase II n=1 Tax=Desulfosporosinus orientis (strain ATCC 19365 / DSM 765 / NCIMB 8382 / VKM B-1628 / Singapore I) TaxID=768706 RepID=G7WE05_DESOD|nr:class I adenylate-forming enzyme family protein [Desulfosporosinus orientis]AET69403.1 acyl-CoA synthetase (AMP-forming)/AMP-acid ligase II [Desulfosporosinus orientis DSM 765]